MNINFLAVEKAVYSSVNSAVIRQAELASDTSGGGYIPPFK